LFDDVLLIGSGHEQSECVRDCWTTGVVFRLTGSEKEERSPHGAGKNRCTPVQATENSHDTPSTTPEQAPPFR
jgi:hypothetical protein